MQDINIDKPNAFWGVIPLFAIEATNDNQKDVTEKKVQTGTEISDNRNVKAAEITLDVVLIAPDIGSANVKRLTILTQRALLNTMFTKKDKAPLIDLRKAKIYNNMVLTGISDQSNSDRPILNLMSLRLTFTELREGDILGNLATLKGTVSEQPTFSAITGFKTSIQKLGGIFK